MGVNSAGMENIMKKHIAIRKRIGVCVMGLLLALSLTACKDKDTDTTDDEEVVEEDNDKAEKKDKDKDKPATETSSIPENLKAIEGDWILVYNLYHSEYGDGEVYDYCEMADDPYGMDSEIVIGEKEGKLVANYKFNAYESTDRFYGVELISNEGSAYTGCENKDWYLQFTNPFEDDYNDDKRITLISDDKLVMAYEYNEEPTEDYSGYHSTSIYTYMRKSDPRLEDKEGLRYFDTVNVSNTTDLLNNLKNNTKIVLEPGTYDFSTVDMSRITNPAIVESYGEVDIQSISNVGIEAKDGADVLLCVDDAYSPVINFTYCNNITLRGVTVGHNVEPGYCSGSVVHINSGSGITIDKCKLFGCGTYGVEAYSCSNLTVTATDIYECTYGLLDLNDVYTARFVNCTLRDSSDMNLININSAYDIGFENCTFKNNKVEWESDYFVNLSEYGDVTFTDCVFENNQYNKFSNRKVKQVNCRVSDNGEMTYEVDDSENRLDREGLLERYDEALETQKDIDDQFEKGSMDQATMNTLAYSEYDLWDTLLNDIWSYLRENLHSEEMDPLTEEQKKWIKEKESSVRDAAADFEGGSMQPMIENGTAAAITKKRVDYLVEKYLK